MLKQIVFFSIQKGKINKSYKLLKHSSFKSRGTKSFAFRFLLNKFIREQRNLLFKNSSTLNTKVAVKQPSLLRLFKKFKTTYLSKQNVYY